MVKKLKLLEGVNIKGKYYMRLRSGEYVCGVMEDSSGNTRRVEGWVLSPTNFGVKVKLHHEFGIGNAELVASLGPIYKLTNPLQGTSITKEPNRTLDEFLSVDQDEISDEITAITCSIVGKLEKYNRKRNMGETNLEGAYYVFTDIMGEIDNFLNETVAEDGSVSLISTIAQVEERLAGCVLRIEQGDKYLVLSAVYATHSDGVVRLLLYPLGGEFRKGLIYLNKSSNVELSLSKILQSLQEDIKYSVSWIKPEENPALMVYFYGKEIGYQAFVDDI